MEQEPESEITPGYRWYVLGLLTIIYIFNLVDRSILSILQEPIKQELGLSDTQLGALTGLAFAVFYAGLAIPIARLADRGFRKIVISVSLGLWSLMTAVSGAAYNFVSLLLFRIGVGVGEAGGVPPAISLISDYFAPNRRATAMSLFGFGVPLGIMFGIMSGGWLNEYLGWRNSFYLVGLLGLLLAPITYFTLRELPRGYSDRIAGSPTPKSMPSPSFVDVSKTLWKLRSFRFVAMAGAAHGFATYAMINWNPPFYLRVHELSSAEVGTYVGLLYGIFGGLGTITGGALADRIGARDLRWYLWVPSIAMFLAVPASLCQYLVNNAFLSFAFAGVTFFLVTVYIGPFYATSQSLVIASMRATTQAIILMTFNIFGLALGPFITGVLSDYLNISVGLGSESLRYALCVSASFNLIASLMFLRGTKYLQTDMARDRSAESRMGQSADATQSSR